MLNRNQAAWDRVLRALVGALSLVAGVSSWAPEPWGTGLEVLGVVLLVTGLAGWCPFYALTGLQTRRR